jgi:ADP-heptose:LPS heptosyltransferase
VRPHVLVARQDSMGDVLLAGPAVRAVATGASRVTILAGPKGAAAAALLQGADQVLTWPAPWIDAEPGPVRRDQVEALVAEVAACAPDQAVILTSFHQTPLPLALLLRLAGVRTIAAISPDYPGSLLDVRHQVDGGAHEVERALSLVGSLGYRLPEEDDGWLAVRRPRLGMTVPLARSPARYAVIHPGASAPARSWGAARHAELAAALEQRGWEVVVTGGPAERGLTARVAAASVGGRVHDLGGRLDLAELAEVLAGAAVVVVGNTGPAHLAAAVGTPVVSLFAPVVPAHVWRPWRVPHVLLGDQAAACAGTRARTCPVPGHPCLDTIDTGEVVAAVEDLASIFFERAGRAAAPPRAVVTSQPGGTGRSTAEPRANGRGAIGPGAPQGGLAAGGTALPGVAGSPAEAAQP